MYIIYLGIKKNIKLNDHNIIINIKTFFIHVYMIYTLHLFKLLIVEF